MRRAWHRAEPRSVRCEGPVPQRASRRTEERPARRSTQLAPTASPRVTAPSTRAPSRRRGRAPVGPACSSTARAWRRSGSARRPAGRRRLAATPRGLLALVSPRWSLAATRPSTSDPPVRKSAAPTPTAKPGRSPPGLWLLLPFAARAEDRSMGVAGRERYRALAAVAVQAGAGSPGGALRHRPQAAASTPAACGCSAAVMSSPECRRPGPLARRQARVAVKTWAPSAWPSWVLAAEVSGRSRGAVAAALAPALR